MDYGGGASPDHYGGGRGGSIRLVCDNCGAADKYNPDDAEDGFFSCRQCSVVHTSTQATAADPDDFQATGTMSFRRLRGAARLCCWRQGLGRARGAGCSGPVALRAGAAGDPATAAGSAGQEVPGGRACLWPGWNYLGAVCGYLQGVRRNLGAEGARGGRGCAETEVLCQWRCEQKPQEVKCEWGGEALPRKDRRRVEFIFVRSLRTMLPLYSTLSVCFLACHIAREAILPTDIYRWAMEGKLPYMAAFTEVDRLLGSSVKHCPLSARQLFRPVRVIGTWQLEAAAGSIAQRIGLQLPSVNFYAIAQRYLNELSLPIERILPHACRIYEWALPAELWLSSNPLRVPTRVCVMAILIVALRVQYNIHGQGIWEEICETGRNADGSDPDENLPPSMRPEGGTSEEFGTRELLCTLASAYDKIDVAHDYSKDLHSYLKYCKDIVFPGIACSIEEDHLIEIFQDMYKGREDGNPKAHMEETQTTNGVMNKRCRDGTSVGARSISASSSGIQRIKSEMEDHGFCYLPPRKLLRSNGYLHYRRKTITGSLVCIGHADYYVLIRSFAKLAEVDVRVLHTSVLKLERRLAWIDERIGRSLDALQNPPIS
ncbi:TATA box-binding protein-associated factor RNA polymerase I subunit B-like [Triticum dicoccoides]|uniref:TATA box-binding protein-associated factor RNA polymerase I subunit B-like n=1 Tax=Triticum dicoccoides TaxID=85692 RepID=UPI0018904FC5|nr:TATA box-binding protein-associated factor RNA polymerase I subunit B-like [Triticum dicoccoides]